MTTPTEKRPKVVAAILTYNCARLLPKAVAQIPKDLVDEILVTDDGSTDDSLAVARRLGLKVFHHTPNRGYGGNLKESLRLALARGADYIVEVHGDGQFHTAALREAWPAIQQGTEFIIGSRFQVRGRARSLGMPLTRFLANRGLSAIDGAILRLPFTEFHAGFRIYSRSFLHRVPWEKNVDNYLFSFQIIAQAAYAGASVAEVPVDADYRGEHTSHSIRGASLYAVRTFGVLLQFLLARHGWRYSHVFPRLAPSPAKTSRPPSSLEWRSAQRRSRPLVDPTRAEGVSRALSRDDLDNVLVTGGGGMIARALPFGKKLSRHDLDVRDARRVAEAVQSLKPSAILHLAALDIRQAEADPQNAYATNVLGTYHLVCAAREREIPLVFLSSGAVFNGGPGHVHDERTRPEPVNVFGQTKWLAEILLRETWEEVLIIRTGWVFGGHQAHHRKFVDVAIEQALRGDPITATADQWGSPTLVTDLTEALQRLLQSGVREIRHVVNAGSASGLDIARFIVEVLGSHSTILPARKDEIPDPGPPRAASEVLGSTDQHLRSWREALRAYLQEFAPLTDVQQKLLVTQERERC